APCRAEDYGRELEDAVGVSWERFCEQLRQVRHRAYLRIGIADLTGRWPVEITMSELSNLAAGAFEAAYRWARHSLCEQYGEMVHASTRELAGGDFVVVGMGKLGGGELNFSSDVDVMYLYADDAVETAGGRRGRLAAPQFFARLAELITRALQEVTAAGLVFRVDLRLRPDGVNG